MKHKRMTTSSGRFIDIYDDVFPKYLTFHHINFVQNSLYTLGGTTSLLFWHHENKTFFRSHYSKEDFDNFKFVNDELMLKLQNHEVLSCWTLASSPLSTYYFHTDTANTEGRLTLLYYVNHRWDRNWGGETLFANDEGECEIAVEYKPNRVVIFDSLIEHKPSPISMESDEFRFTFVIQLRSKISNTNQ